MKRHEENKSLSRFFMDYIHRQMQELSCDAQNLSTLKQWALCLFTSVVRTASDFVLSFHQSGFKTGRGERKSLPRVQASATLPCPVWARNF